MSVERKLKASFNFNTLFFFVLFFSITFCEKKNNRGQTLWGRIAPALSAKNPGSCHNLGQYKCAKGRHCTENHLHRIRTPLICCDLKFKDRFIKKKKNVSFRKKFVPAFVCGLYMFSYELPLLN